MTSTKRTFDKRAIALLCALSLMVPLSQVSSAGKRNKRYKERTSQLGAGISYTRIRDYRGPFRVRVVTVDLDQGSTLDTVLAKDRLPKFETTSSMAARTGAVAAINGDYARSSGRPVFTFAADGVLSQTALTWGRNFATNADESATYIGHPNESGWAREADGGPTYPIDLVNRSVSEVPISPTEVRMFTWQGKKDAKPPAGHCLVRLYPLEGPRISDDTMSTERAMYVDEVACDGRTLHARNGVVLAATLDSQYALAFQSLFPGEELTVAWSVGWPSVLDTIGGNPTLIEAGQIISKNVDGCGSFCARHPRTGVGTTPDGRVLLVTVDGRQSGYSVGMSLREFAELFARLGADWALNLDGGGSTTMVVDGDVVNRPSDKDSDGKSVERAVSSALVLLPGADPGEQPGSEPSPGPVPPFNRVSGSIATDPASTGGMLDAMARRGYFLTPDLLQTLRLFRSSR